MRYIFLLSFVLLLSCQNQEKTISIEAFQTSESGDKLSPIKAIENESDLRLKINASQNYQTIQGFGGAFTESSSYLLNEISTDKREEIIDAYFSQEGLNYSLTRTHMNSCDFSLSQYDYTSVNDTFLSSFDIAPDMDDIIPFIKDAQKVSEEGFQIIASPWTAPPWMKDNNEWFGGKLKKEFYPSWASYFSRYLDEYKKQGIDIWALTIENEPLGNGSHWESMHFTPEETADFVRNHLVPTLKENGQVPNLLVYDQNRGDELKEWVDVLLTDSALLPDIYGTAVHWYNSTYDYFPESLDHTHELAPNHHIINTEACIDAEVPHWNDDAWYWKKEATDWGWDWAKDQKFRHPKYVPTFRLARDIIGCLNHWVEGWVDWNMVLDQNGGPNHAKNWCIAPVIVNIESDEVYYTPLYYIMGHFSKFIRPGAKRIELNANWEEDTFMSNAIQNEDGSIVVTLLNMSKEPKDISIDFKSQAINYRIKEKALVSILINEG